MAFLTFFTRHTATTAPVAVATKENAPDTTGESLSGIATPSIEPAVDGVIDEKSSIALNDDDDVSRDSTPDPALPQSTDPSSTTPTPLDALTSFNIPSLSQVAAAMLDRKDQRAYEVARQRTKKPADREKAREQKVKHRYAAAMGMGNPKARNERPAKAPLDAGNGRRGSVTMGAGAGDDGDDATAMTASPRKVREAGAVTGHGARRVHEIRFEDLLRTAKVRKQKGVCEMFGSAPCVVLPLM